MDSQQLGTLCSAISKVLATPHGEAAAAFTGCVQCACSAHAASQPAPHSRPALTPCLPPLGPGASLLPAAADLAQEALQSPEHRLRQLGCEQLGRLLLLHGGEAQQQVQAQQEQLEAQVLGALADADVAVACTAERALVQLYGAQPAAFAALLAGSCPAAGQLQALADSSNATQRMRAFALLTAAAGAGHANAEQLKQSGGLQEGRCCGARQLLACTATAAAA